MERNSLNEKYVFGINARASIEYKDQKLFTIICFSSGCHLVALWFSKEAQFQVRKCAHFRTNRISSIDFYWSSHRITHNVHFRESINWLMDDMSCHRLAIEDLSINSFAKSVFCHLHVSTCSIHLLFQTFRAMTKKEEELYIGKLCQGAK